MYRVGARGEGGGTSGGDFYKIIAVQDMPGQPAEPFPNVAGWVKAERVPLTKRQRAEGQIQVPAGSHVTGPDGAVVTRTTEAMLLVPAPPPDC